MFGLLGNAIFLFSLYQTSESIILGNVVDEEGQILPKVLIDTGGHARGMTSDTGEFVLAIPASRVQDSYEVSAVLPGYERATQSVDQQARMFAHFVLKKTKTTSNRVLGLSDTNANLGHLLGAPELYLSMALSNPSSSTLTLNDFSVDLVAPSGRTRHLVNPYTGPTAAGPMSPLPQVLLQPGQSFPLIQYFIEYNNSVQQLWQSTIQKLQADAAFRTYGAQPNRDYLSAQDGQIMAAAMDRNWFWEPGTTRIVYSCNANGVRFELERSVTLTPDQVDGMKRIADHYRDGYGIVTGYELAPIGDARPGFPITLQASMIK
jgi:hypothetical protein